MHFEVEFLIFSCGCLGNSLVFDRERRDFHISARFGVVSKGDNIGEEIEDIPTQSDVFCVSDFFAIFEDVSFSCEREFSGVGIDCVKRHEIGDEKTAFFEEIRSSLPNHFYIVHSRISEKFSVHFLSIFIITE